MAKEPRTRPSLDGLNLDLLVTLDALLSAANVSRAAEKLGTSQPSVSRGLASLRDAFADPLLVRSSRSESPGRRTSDS